MDYLRSCYQSSMRLYNDRPDVYTEGAWSFCPPGAKTLPFVHAFGSGSWDDYRISDDPLLGEVKPRGGWVSGTPDKGADGKHFCGTAEEWVHGVQFGFPDSLQRDLAGNPLCCPRFQVCIADLLLEADVVLTTIAIGEFVVEADVVLTTGAIGEFVVEADVVLTTGANGEFVVDADAIPHVYGPYELVLDADAMIGLLGGSDFVVSAEVVNPLGIDSAFVLEADSISSMMIEPACGGTPVPIHLVARLESIIACTCVDGLEVELVYADDNLLESGASVGAGWYGVLPVACLASVDLQIILRPCVLSVPDLFLMDIYSGPGSHFEGEAAATGFPSFDPFDQVYSFSPSGPTNICSGGLFHVRVTAV